MTKFYGKVGYGLPGEFVNGVWSDDIKERDYYGDVFKEVRYLQPGDQVNDDIRLAHRISIVADAFAFANYAYIKYVNLSGVLWSVSSVDVEHPRLILSLGGVYNAPKP